MKRHKTCLSGTTLFSLAHIASGCKDIKYVSDSYAEIVLGPRTTLNYSPEIRFVKGSFEVMRHAMHKIVDDLFDRAEKRARTDNA